MKYAIVGAGNVGKALAKAFARKGIEVALASRRSAEELSPIATAIGPQVKATSLQAALSADVLLLAVPFRAYRDLAASETDWSGKLVLDAMNAYGVPTVDYGDVLSSEAVAKALPGAALVKAFNHLPAKILAEDPQVGGAKRVIFLSSNDESATARVTTLVEELGFAPVDLGPLAGGGAALHAQGNKWGPLCFQDLLKES